MISFPSTVNITTAPGLTRRRRLSSARASSSLLDPLEYGSGNNMENNSSLRQGGKAGESQAGLDSTVQNDEDSGLRFDEEAALDNTFAVSYTHLTLPTNREV